MKVNHLNLENYRNFPKLEIDFDAVGAIIYGKNGIGKTNLLEAIAYSAFGRSFQTIHDRDLKNFNSDFFRISAQFTYRNKQLQIDSAFSNEQKKIRINELKINKLSELFKYIKIVYFSPRDIDFSAGNPGFRRNFFDLAISQNSFQYIETLKEYNRILKQRNALFKTDYLKSEKDSWDDRFVQTGTEIIKLRKEYLLKFIPVLTEYLNFISDNSEILTFEYIHSFPLEDGKELSESFRESLLKNEKREKEYNRSLYGPHLDDINFMINGRSFKRFGSQGQKRSLAISARLAQAKLISQSDGEFPILMFDDVLADLDKVRTSNILKLIKIKHQIFIATPNKNHYEISHFPEIDLEDICEAE